MKKKVVDLTCVQFIFSYNQLASGVDEWERGVWGVRLVMQRTSLTTPRGRGVSHYTTVAIHYLLKEKTSEKGFERGVGSQMDNMGM